ncbi:HutD family protein [Streptomyces sp. NPDC058623]|uniref:HutD/Ves family protein n=1 Tax=Streptomyces sp. NPDC058623 TaxID=3346563 RepID=UPI0036463409
MSTPAGARLLRAADRAAAPWKNGGGVTREIAAWPEHAGTDDFAWRVSLAEVDADGPFSVFPGVDRTLTLAEGAGMDLTVAGERRLVDERWAPRHFPGDRPTHCRLLDGPVVNFNVMYRRDRTEARTTVVRGAFGLTVAPDETVLVVALDGPLTVEPTDARGGPPARLAPYDALLADAPLSALVRTTGSAALVRLRARGSLGK